MNTIFDKKKKSNFPKRTLAHKAQISLTFLCMFCFLINSVNHNLPMAALNIACGIFWSVNWYFSKQKYKQAVVEYKEQVFQEQQDLEMKNAFNFGYYQNK